MPYRNDDCDPESGEHYDNMQGMEGNNQDIYHDNNEDMDQNMGQNIEDQEDPDYNIDHEIDGGGKLTNLLYIN